MSTSSHAKHPFVIIPLLFILIGLGNLAGKLHDRSSAPSNNPKNIATNTSEIDPSEHSAAKKTNRYWPGLPLSPNEKLIELQHLGYETGYSTQVFCPRWTAYVTIGDTTPKSEGRPSSFLPDPNLTKDRQVQTQEYNSSNYDRGHMAPNWAISISYGREAQLETFYTTNICPQRPECNRQLWEDLERIEANDYARRYGSVVSYVGPVFGPNPQGLGKNGRIKIPNAFYKIIVRQYKGQTGVLAFLVPQFPAGHGREALVKYLVPVNEIETKTGLVFFNRISTDETAALKQALPTKLW